MVFGLTRLASRAASWALLGARPGASWPWRTACTSPSRPSGTYIEGRWLDAIWPASALAGRASRLGQAVGPPAARLHRAARGGDPVGCGLLALGLVGYGLFEDIGTRQVFLAMATLLLVTRGMALAFSDNQRAMLAAPRHAGADRLAHRPRQPPPPDGGPRARHLGAGHGRTPAAVRDPRPRRVQGLQRQLRPPRRGRAARAARRQARGAVAPARAGLPPGRRRVLRAWPAARRRSRRASWPPRARRCRRPARASRLRAPPGRS